MKVPFTLLLSLSWRNLLRNARRTSLLVMAVTLGVGSLVMFAAILEGWMGSTEEDAVDTLVGHLRIHAEGWLDEPRSQTSFVVTQELRATLESDAHVTAWTSRIRIPAVGMSERETRGFMLLGVNPADETGLSFIGDAEVAGEALDGSTDRGIVIGRGLLEELETGLGKRIVVMVQAPDGSTSERGFRVIGVFSDGSSAVEKGYAFTGRETLRSMARMPDGHVTEVSARLDRDGAAALEDVEARYAALLPDLDVRSWKDLMAQAAAIIEMSDAMIWIWYVIMMSALGFGLVNTLLSSIMERVRELGTLQALGMRPSGVLWQVLFESWLILALGMTAGLALGLLCVWSLADGVDLGRWAAGLEMMGVESVLYPRSHPDDLFQIMSVVAVLGLLGSLYPARKAVQIDPLRALTRQE